MSPSRRDHLLLCRRLHRHSLRHRPCQFRALSRALRHRPCQFRALSRELWMPAVPVVVWRTERAQMAPGV